MLKALALSLLALLAGAVAISSLGIVIGFPSIEAFQWFLKTASVPVAIAGIVLHLARPRGPVSVWRVRLAAALVAFGAVTLAGSAGAILNRALMDPWERINLTGYIAWAPAYALGFLPLTYPLSLRLVRAIWRTE
jgi:hypothetical protein